MAKKIKGEGVEIVFFLPCTGITSFSGSGSERHEAGSPRSISHANSKAHELGKKISKAFGDYEGALDSFETRNVTDAICEHCGATWTEESSTYNGGCCAADQDAEDARTSAVTA